MKSLAKILPVLVLLVGCQTTPYSDFNKVDVGYEKGQVLSLLGNPDHRYRKADTDRWVYRFPEGKDQKQFIDKEIWFQNGRVVYRDTDSVGPKEKAKPQDSDFEQVK